ncbi:MAG: alpha-mannosidase [Lachnospiraceae bacterium]
MKFAKERAQVICSQLRGLSIVKRIRLGDFQMKKGCFIDVKEVDESEIPWEPFEAGKDLWYGPDGHYWFRTTVTIPEELDQKPVQLRIHTGLTDWDDGQNPQFLAFIDGEVVQGLDINHREIVLSHCAEGGKTFQLDLQSYTGTLHSELKLLADIEQVALDVKALYYDIQVPLWGLNRMEENDKERFQIETIVTDTINLIDLRKPYTKEFHDSIKVASDYIGKALYEDLAGYSDIVATCIGHTHIDVAWLWTVEQVRQKSCRSFATVLKLMKEYPNYKFMSSQPQLYEFVKERHPEMYEEIKERVKEGRWEPEGGMWVEADCNLTSGESLVRQFLVGKKFFKEEFDKDNYILWLPDVFGYSAALPQIMKKSGIQYFMTTKLAWNEYNKLPNDTFMWEGIDGSQILTHLITTLGVNQSESSFFTTYNGMLHPDAIMGAWRRYSNKEINDDILISYGYGDGGGGPTRRMLETSKRMEKGIKGIPKVRQEGSLTYFRELEARVKDNRRLATWVGELYFEYHRGTYTSMARNKRSNRKAEFDIMNLELLSVLAEKYGVAYPKEELDALWKLILRNQFHDILPGSSIREVYDVTKVEYAQMAEQMAAMIKERIEAMIEKQEGLTVFNTLGFERNDVVSLGQVSAAGVTDGIRVYPVQQTENGAIAYVEHMPSKGYLTLSGCDAAAEVPFSFDGTIIETPYYQITLDDKAQFTSIYDKKNDREVLKPGTIGNELRVYEDKPCCYSSWNIDVFYTEKSYAVDNVVSLSWEEVGPVRATLKVERQFMDCVIRQKIHFYANTARIDFETYVDWKLCEHLMKVHFPIDIHTDEATFDIQFGNLKRKIHQNTSWDVARFESCAQKWMDMSEGGYGVSLLNDCKYGHSALNGVMSLTLLKSGTEPNKTADQEEHYFTYSLYPHAGSWQQGGTVKEAMNLNVPAIAVAGQAKNRSMSFMSVDQPNVVLETIKQAEDKDGIIVRCYEVENCRSKVTLTVNHPIAEAIETNLMEEAEGNVEVNGNQITFQIKPYEIKTFRLK